MIPFPQDKFDVILADPPWSYDDKMQGHSFSLDHEYETQNLEWIQSLPITDISQKDCALFLWVPNPMLDDGIETLIKWGFSYKTVAFCWVKTTKNDKIVTNLGRWTMASIELCLLGVKGHPHRINKDIKQIVFAQRREHSRKPDEVRERIDDLMGEVKKIELFARSRYEGWESYGDQIDDNVITKKYSNKEQQQLF